MTSEDITKRFVLAYYKIYGLKEVRTRKEFCEKVDSASSNFKCMEAGSRNATVDNICRLIDVYGVSPVWLFLGTGDFRTKIPK